MGDVIHPFPPREARLPTKAMDFSDRLRLAGLHGELAMAQLAVVRASAEYSLSASEIDRDCAVMACSHAIEALQGIALLLTPSAPPKPTDAA